MIKYIAPKVFNDDPFNIPTKHPDEEGLVKLRSPPAAIDWREGRQQAKWKNDVGQWRGSEPDIERPSASRK
ncbi:hypothetical protein NLJ89_g3302 [Agrocybe chaxingu]|uniref:Uncharacterized protein n=1 Tax=Agrocybe chaxingu TaxID=84603 RepID=A0A9W8K4Z5_9AGAR|nr:hypothetical protein NLJ89_g3302 [Agrocybe chaxingu]